MPPMIVSTDKEIKGFNELRENLGVGKLNPSQKAAEIILKLIEDNK